MNTGHMPRTVKADHDRPCAICGHKEADTLYFHGKIGELESAQAALCDALEFILTQFSYKSEGDFCSTLSANLEKLEAALRQAGR